MVNKHINNKSFSIGSIEIVKKYEKKLFLCVEVVINILVFRLLLSFPYPKKWCRFDRFRYNMGEN